jgi:Pentose-5-phosphate-3-epimerase
MKIATSILTILDNEEKIKEVNNSKTDYIHLDIMDGFFVENKTSLEHINYLTKNIDIHFMVKDIKEYIKKYSHFNPEFITFHYEATDDIDEIISYLKNMNIKVGLSINPDTGVRKIEKYLDKVDLVLVMSVYPGKGGQKFIPESVLKISELNKIRKDKKLNYLIEVDGGIDENTCKVCKGADILVVGNFATNYGKTNEQLQKIKNKFL